MGSSSPTPLRLAILECGTPPPVAAARFGGGYGSIFEALFTAAVAPEPASAHFTFSVHDVVHDFPSVYPPLDSGIDALVMTGSKHDAFADDPWILELVKYVKGALAKGVKVVGVCFGHQIVGRAMGAPVGRNDKGWEVSVTPMRLSEKGRELFGGEDTLKIHQMHRDIVSALPDGAELLASTDVCAVQGFVVPGKAITMQGHPEFDEPIAREILKTRRGLGVHSEELYQSGLARVAEKHDGVRIARAFVKFLREG